MMKIFYIFADKIFLSLMPGNLVVLSVMIQWEHISNV